MKSVVVGFFKLFCMQDDIISNYSYTYSFPIWMICFSVHFLCLESLPQCRTEMLWAYLLVSLLTLCSYYISCQLLVYCRFDQIEDVSLNLSCADFYFYERDRFLSNIFPHIYLDNHVLYLLIVLENETETQRAPIPCVILLMLTTAGTGSNRNLERGTQFWAPVWVAGFQVSWVLTCCLPLYPLGWS